MGTGTIVKRKVSVSNSAGDWHVRTRDDGLIATYIEQNSQRPGLEEARLKGFGVPVWALVGYYFAVGARLQRVAEDYELPEDAISAALAYYQRYRAFIDARLDANAAAIA